MELEKNQNFVQFNRNAMLCYQELIGESPIAARLMVLIGSKMDKTNALMVSIDTLCELTGNSRRGVSNGIKLLKDKKYIQVVRVGNMNAYVVNSSVFWTSDAKKRIYSKFNATVVASFTEQESGFDAEVRLKKLVTKRVGR